MRKTKRYIYEGSRFKFKKDESYTMKEIAKGMGTSYQYVADRLKNKDKFLDEYFLTSTAPRLYKFNGNYVGLKKGQKYTLVELEEITGIRSNALQKRIKDGERVLYNWHVRASQSNREVLERPTSHSLSKEWLRKKL